MHDDRQADNEFKGSMDMILCFLDGCKRYFALALISVFFLAMFELVNPKIIGYTVDLVIGEEEAIPQFVLQWIASAGGRTYVLEHLWMIALLVILLALIGAVSRYCYSLYTSKGAEALGRKMRNMLYAHIVHLPNAWMDENKTGDIIQRCTSDVDMIKQFISQQLTNLVRMVVMILLALFFMLGIHVKLTLVVLIFVPIVIFRSFSFHKNIGESFRACDEEEGRLSAIVQENLTGVRVVRAFGREQYEKDRFVTKNENYTKLWIRMMGILSRFWVSVDLICGLEVLAVLVLGSYLAVKGELTAGSFVAFVSYNALLFNPVRQLGRLISEMSKAGVSSDRLLYIMNSRCEEDDADAVDYPGHEDIIFSHVSYGYDSGEEEKKYVLRDIDMVFPKGRTIGILGGTGSGKTTLMQLLDGFYTLQEGEGSITIGGIDIRKIHKDQLRSHIGMVLQEPYLFSRSIEDNLTIAVSEQTDDAVRHQEMLDAAHTACLDTAVEKFKEGYATFVGERGVTLSGGQKQRTAIAQMLIRHPDVMVFDDSLSAVDAQTDARIRHMLKQDIHDATVILISHRITTLMQADYIYVLDQGKVAEEGTHETLTAMDGLYRKIYNLQITQGEVTDHAS